MIRRQASSSIPDTFKTARGKQLGLGRPARQLAAALVLVVLPAACSSVDARVHNLGELHGESGVVSYRAALVGESEYLMRRAFSVSAPFGFEFNLEEAELELIEDPSGTCLDNLLALKRFSSDDARHLALQTEMYTWLATGDPYILARELCVLELGKIGWRFGVTEPIAVPANETQPSVEELTGTITTLIESAGSILGGATPETALSLEDACTAIADRELGIPSGRRVLRTCAVLLSSSSSAESTFDPIRDLVHDLGKRMTSIALGRARFDSSSLVRSAAVIAWTHATDNRAGEMMIQSLDDYEPTVLHQVLREIATHGLPRSMNEQDEKQRNDWRENWLRILVQLAHDRPDGLVSSAACKSLGVVSGAGFESLRYEDWIAWWVKRAEAQVDADRVLKAGA